ncbi:MAG: hypothetical protein KTR32_29400 [Granulosicoccus sp.]|nr:hypothetical protein [Granulosicoccus sp.]
MHNSTDGLTLSDAEKQLLDKIPDADREARLRTLESQLASITTDNDDPGPDTTEAFQRAQVWLEMAGLLLDLDRKTEAWDYARPSIEILVAHEAFEDAALACQYVYLADQFDAIPAIGQAAWLAVTYPVDPHLTANILHHIIDETPDDSDGAAVAAATAHYVVDIRSTEAQREELRLFTGANLARVAKRHGRVDSQQTFELWVERLELDIPEKFLVRLRNVIDVMVQFDWWFDREELQEKIPE